jgi:CheY-like chemotaxis protein
MHVLIIDDDIFMRKILSHLLLELGHSVAVAGDGLEAMNLVSGKERFDLIFCDIMMPIVSGPSFLLRLKKYYPKKLPVITIMSGVHDGREFLKTIDTKYDHFLQKPFEAEELVKLINEVSRQCESPTA